MPYDGVVKPRDPLKWILTQIAGDGGEVLLHHVDGPLDGNTKDDKGVVYAAVRTEGGQVEAVVALFFEDMSADPDQNFLHVKVLSEQEGPVACDCPANILAVLTPTDNAWSLEWRESCLASLDASSSSRPH